MIIYTCKQLSNQSTYAPNKLRGFRNWRLLCFRRETTIPRVSSFLLCSQEKHYLKPLWTTFNENNDLRNTHLIFDYAQERTVDCEKWRVLALQFV